MKQTSAYKTYYEIGFTLLLILNAFLLLYFITKLNQIENVTLDTQAKTIQIMSTLKISN